MATSKKTLDKVTIYTVGAFGLSRVEASGLTMHRGPYAQYQNAIHVQYKPKGAQKARGLVKYDNGSGAPVLVIVEGWGHPEGPDAFGAPTMNANGVESKETRFACFDPRYTQEAIAFLQDYIKGHKVRLCILSSEDFKTAHDALEPRPERNATV